jgi:hypothetical protein
MNYNRPIHRIMNERKKEYAEIRKKPLGTEPVQPTRMKFGKYKGFTLKAVPTNYLEWLVSVTTDDNEAMKYCRELADRPNYLKKLCK